MRTPHKFVFVCAGKDCKKAGSRKLLENLPQVLKDKGARSRLQIVKTKCLDLCGTGPNMIYDNRIYTNINQDLLNDVMIECFRAAK